MNPTEIHEQFKHVSSFRGGFPISGGEPAVTSFYAGETGGETVFAVVSSPVDLAHSWAYDGVVRELCDNLDDMPEFAAVSQALGITVMSHDSTLVALMPDNSKRLNLGLDRLDITDRRFVGFEDGSFRTPDVISHLARSEFLVATAKWPRAMVHDMLTHVVRIALEAPETVKDLATEASQIVDTIAQTEVHDAALQEGGRLVQRLDTYVAPTVIFNSPNRHRSLLGRREIGDRPRTAAERASRLVKSATDILSTTQV